MARKTQKEAMKTRAKILASALSLFAVKGFENTTFTDIAARLKMTKGAVYWHFASKIDLLKALVEEMLAKFHRQIAELTPQEELTFLAVTNMMVRNAQQIVSDVKGTAFFRLMKCQVKWSDTSMADFRQNLLEKDSTGPVQTLIQALENDKRAKRVRANVNEAEVAACCLALWDGLVQSRIDHFLQCDLTQTLSNAYKAVWESIKQ